MEISVLLLYTLLATAKWYLGIQAKVTEPLWSRYPTAIEEFASCPACIGFWIWIYMSTIGIYTDLLPAPIPILPPETQIVSAGFLGLVLTPLGAFALNKALDGLYTDSETVPDQEPTEHPERCVSSERAPIQQETDET